MPKGPGIPTRSKDKVAQNLTGGKVGRRMTPPTVTGAGVPTRSTAKFPQDLTGGKNGRRFNPPG